MEENESIEASIRGKMGLDTRASRRVELIDKVLRLGWFIIGGIVFITLWAGRLQWTVWDQGKTVDELIKLKIERNIQIDSLKNFDTSVTLSLAQVGARIDAINENVKRDTARLDKIEPEHIEMYLMKTHGISNRESFFQEHGYQAPPGSGDK